MIRHPDEFYEIVRKSVTKGRQHQEVTKQSRIFDTEVEENYLYHFLDEGNGD